MSADEKDDPASSELSIVDLIIQEQMEKNALVLAPQEKAEEPTEDEEQVASNEEGSEVSEESGEPQESEESPDLESEESHQDGSVEPAQPDEEQPSSDDAEITAEEPSSQQEQAPVEVEQENSELSEESTTQQADLEEEAQAEAPSEPTPEPEAESVSEDPPLEETEEDDDWELTPEELAELRELEAEFEAEQREAAEAGQEAEEAVSGERETLDEEEGESPEEASEESPAEAEESSDAVQTETLDKVELEIPKEAARASEAAQTESQDMSGDQTSEGLEGQASETPAEKTPEAAEIESPEVLEIGLAEEASDEQDDSFLVGPATVELSADDFFGAAEAALESSESVTQEPEKSPPVSSQSLDPLSSAIRDAETAALNLTPLPLSEPPASLPPEDSAAEEPVSTEALTPEPIAASSPQAPESSSPVPSSLGGKLRDVEKLLADSPSDNLPFGIEKRALQAMKHLASLKNIQRAMVLAVTTGGELKCVVSGGMGGEKSLEQAPLRLLRSVHLTKEPLLLLNAQKDPRFSKQPRIQKLGIKSVLVVPFEDCRSGAKGLLYVDNLEMPNAFAHQDLAFLKDLAEQMASDYQFGETQESAAKPEPSELLTEAKVFDPRWYIAAAATVMLLLWPALSNPTVDKKAAPPPRAPVSRVTSDPKSVVLMFIRALETRNTKSAYLYLSTKQQEKIELEKFGKRIEKFVSKDDNAFILSRLKVVEDSRSFGKTKRYRLVPVDEVESSWKIVLAESDEGKWHVTKILGMKGLSLQ